MLSASYDEPAVFVTDCAVGPRSSMQEDFLANLDQLVALSSQRKDTSTGEKPLAPACVGAAKHSSRLCWIPQHVHE